MRIGFFTDTFLPQKNGVVTSLLSTGPELVRRGHEVFIFCPKTNVRGFAGMQVCSYPAVTFRPYPEFKIAVPQGRESVPELDIVHSHSPFTMGFFGWRVANFQKIPRVTTFHTLLSEYVCYVATLGKKIMEKVVWKYCEIFYNKQHGIIAPSRALREVLRSHQIKRAISIIPTGIDTNFFKPEEREYAREVLRLKGEKFFLSLGRLGYEKNIDVIIRAFAEVDGKLVIAGRGPAAKKLRDLRDRLGLRKKVSFVGYVPEKLKPLYYSAADAFIIASTGETQALVVLEAMACGCPVIGANSLAIPEFIKDGKNGYLFEPGNVAQLAEILNSYVPSQKMQNQALKTGKKFSVVECTKKLERFYRKHI
ncbi:MAG: glycosyltransferase [Candidatus Hadarchaeum sp.]|uniref:glycosyltransferase n=1 Tax=Candidatus Hadarchaeum sp. TaxID=2883567 RepID=UPI003D0EC347